MSLRTHRAPLPRSTPSLARYDGFAADVWSLGVTLAELGSAPDHAVPRQRDLLDAARRDAALGAIRDRRWRGVVARALDEDPRARPRAEELRAGLVAASAARDRFALAVGLA